MRRAVKACGEMMPSSTFLIWQALVKRRQERERILRLHLARTGRKAPPTTGYTSCEVRHPLRAVISRQRHFTPTPSQPPCFPFTH